MEWLACAFQIYYDFSAYSDMAVQGVERGSDVALMQSSSRPAARRRSGTIVSGRCAAPVSENRIGLNRCPGVALWGLNGERG